MWKERRSPGREGEEMPERDGGAALCSSVGCCFREVGGAAKDQVLGGGDVRTLGEYLETAGLI